MSMIWLNYMKIWEEGWWIVEITVLPCLASLFKNLIKLRDVVESRPVVGSSKKIIEGFISNSRPMEVLFLSPPDTPLILVSPIQVSLHFYRPRFLIIISTLLTFYYSERFGSLRSVTNLND